MRGNEMTCKNMIVRLIGQFMDDMATESRHMVMKWVRKCIKGPIRARSVHKADMVDKVHDKYDWFLILEAAWYCICMLIAQSIRQQSLNIKRRTLLS
jgi:hypothetical protein